MCSSLSKMVFLWTAILAALCVVASGAAVEDMQTSFQDEVPKHFGLHLRRTILRKRELTPTTRQNPNADYDDGFTSQVNDGTGVFRPIRPGSEVHAANDFEIRQPDDDNDNVQESPEAEDNVCFPGSAMVQLVDGSKRVMHELRVGDLVLTANGKFSPVFMFTHRLRNIRYTFVRLSTESGHRIALTKGHYLYVNGRLSSAASVVVGDVLILADGSSSQVVRIEKVKDTGLYNPQTVDGDIVVDSVRASTYTTSVDVCVAHALLAPLRAAYNRFGLYLSSLESGANHLASWVPSGSSIV